MVKGTCVTYHRYTEGHQQISAGLYTRQKVPGDRETTSVQKVPVMTRALALPVSQ